MGDDIYYDDILYYIELDKKSLDFKCCAINDDVFIINSHIRPK